MRVILLKDVPKVGKRNDVKELNDGFATNFLIRRGLAEVATDKAMKALEIRKQSAEEQKMVNESLIRQGLKLLEEVTLNLEEKVSSTGHLFQGIGPEKISAELKGHHGIDIPENMILLEKHIKEVGEFLIPVKFLEREGKIKLVIKPKS